MTIPVRPQHITRFIEFIFLGAPKKLFIIGKRLIALTNYELSFTLNLRLILIPLFGDYTRVGRAIGVVVRLLCILSGLVALALLSLVVFLLPILWYFALFGLIYGLGGFSLAVGLVFFGMWYLSVKNKPFASGQPRPYVADLFRDLAIRGNIQLKDFLASPHVLEMCVRLELSGSEFPLAILNSLSYQQVVASHKAWESKAYGYMRDFGNLYVEPEHVFLAIVSSLSGVDRLLSKYGLVIEDFVDCARWLLAKRDEKATAHVWQAYYKLPAMGGIGKGSTGRVTPGLDQVSTDYTRLVKEGLVERTYWRKDEIKRVADLLGGSNRNVLVVGPPGCGKTGIIKGIAYSVIKGTEYDHLKFKRIVSLEVGKILAGTKGGGDVADKLKKALEDALGSGDVILFVDDIHTLVAGSSAEDSRTSIAYTTLVNYLSNGRLQFIGATNVENYRKYIEPNGSFAQMFQVVEVPASSKPETLEIIKTKARNSEEEFKVFVTFCALRKIVELGDKLIHERVFPDKAVDILNRCVAKVHKDSRIVNTSVVLEVLSEVTHIPVTAVSQEESQKLLNIEAEMKKRVIGQDEAVAMVGSALKRARAGIRNESKPIASFLFVGTTGVGKTETAKALARCYFGDEKLMIRLDMSEYQQKDSLSRLLGDPNGSSKGILIEAVRTRPFSLILLDEIEKAHQDILLTFLQVLDDGRLTDSSGFTANFTNTILIATSNVGTRSIQAIFARNGTFEEMKDTVIREVREKFAPEFLNRFTGIVVYKPLNMESVRRITDIMLGSVRKMADDKGIKLSFKPELVEELLKRGYSPEWGARPMARVIEETVMNYLSIKILSHEVVRGDAIELGAEVFR